MLVPEQGQLVQVRNRHFVVDDVFQHHDNGSLTHKVVLECLDDDTIGKRLEVIWERELHPEVYDTSQLPEPTDWDSPERFESFLHAIDWSASSLLGGRPLQAAFRGAIELEEYQLVPVARALPMSRVNLLLADDVGLGKTIEAALVTQELISRQRVRRVLIVCPASLQRQWQDEMKDKFHLPFRIINADQIQTLRREYGVHVNPWNSYPRLITSMDFLKQDNRLQTFRAALERERAGSVLRDWDLLIVDEVHNCSPSGRKIYVQDSDRTRMLREITPHFEHKLFLTATPHNGYTESFTSLLEMLDPLRFNRGPEIHREALDLIMIRRLKDEITDSLGRRKFAERHVEPIPVTLGDRETQVCADLDSYCESRMARATREDRFAIQFALTMLKKRFLSSPHAFWRSLQTHTKTTEADERSPDAALTQRLAERVQEDWDDDDEKARFEDAALQEASQFFVSLTREERSWLRRLADTAQDLADKPDSKARELIAWIEENLRPSGEWNSERLIVFTEYRDTLDYLHELLIERGWDDQVIILAGGMRESERERVKAAFQSPPSSENPVRILLGTDAASEGLNLQNHCRHVIHCEIPWNPNRMAQRNGRVDRHGQKAKDVYCWHFHYTNNADQRFLEVVVDKVRTQRADLGAVGDVIASQVEKAILRQRDRIEDPTDRVQRQEAELRAEVWAKEQARTIQDDLLTTRRAMDLYPDTMAQALDEALKLNGHLGLAPIEHGDLSGKAYDLRNLPTSWHDSRQYLLNEHGARLHLAFDPDVAKDRRDVALIHLGHPLMKRATSVFRSFLWEQLTTSGQKLHRTSYRVLPHKELPKPALVAYGRAVAVSSQGERLHEELVRLGGWIDERDLQPIDAELLSQLIDTNADHQSIPKSVGDDLRQLFPFHQAALEKMFGELEQAETERIETALDKRAEKVVTQIRQLISERLREIRKRLKDIKKEREAAQLRLFDGEELAQYEEDESWLRRREEQLQRDRETEPDAARERYKLKSLRIFPLGIMYLLPDSLVAERSGE